MAIRKKSAKKARNISREPLQGHVRNARGAGRKPVASIMVPLELKEQFDCFKAAYAAREGSATNEQVLRRWMDGIGTAFDSKLAQEARKLYRQRLQAAKAEPEVAAPATE
jgi:hypothetical protein